MLYVQMAAKDQSDIVFSLKVCDELLLRISHGEILTPENGFGLNELLGAPCYCYLWTVFLPISMSSSCVLRCSAMSSLSNGFMPKIAKGTSIQSMARTNANNVPMRPNAARPEAAEGSMVPPVVNSAHND
jgi:hypothetical protein